MQLSFGRQIFLSILTVSGLSVLLISVPSLFNSASHFRSIATEQARTDAVMLGNIVEPALVFDRNDLGDEMLKILGSSPHVIAATVLKLDADSGELVPFASFGNEGSAAQVDVRGVRDTRVESLDGNLISVTPIYSSGEIIGYIRLLNSMETFRHHFRDTLIYVVIAMGVSLLVAVYLAVAARRALLRPIKNLSQVTTQVAQTKDYSMRADVASEDEVGALIQSFNAMLDVIQSYDQRRREKEDEILLLNESLERKVKERTLELQRSMNELSSTIEDLRTTQSKLVEQEKMASLGSLVAGVAHEINTPIGVGITASSHLSHAVSELNQQFEAGTLTKRRFAEAVQEMTETVQMITKNLERSAALVKSFKMVAVDQGSDDVREFNVREYFESVLLSLKPRLKRTRHVVMMTIPDDLVINSYPGALSQIITNLVMNSLQHGFADKSEGRIEMQVEQHGDSLVFDYFDDGRGIPDAIKGRIFDPFVTTARNQGGSGLGTHILYNLVTQVLGGSVSLQDDRPQGVHFRIRFPLAPHPAMNAGG